MNEIDKWYAEQCGVRCTREDTHKWYYPEWYPTPENHSGCHEKFEWTIQDPRCSEIVRERFRIKTVTNNDENDMLCWAETMDYIGGGKTIAEAEICCITAIYEARNDI